MAKKIRAEDFIHHLFVHMNDVDQFVIFSGLSLKQFFLSAEPIKNILLLKHTYEDGSFNMHTQFDFVPKEDMTDFVKKLSDLNGDLCWIDFSSEKNVNQLHHWNKRTVLF